MKHIRKFNLFESTFDPMYYQIDDEEFIKLARNPESFESEIDQIRKILNTKWAKIIAVYSSKMAIQTKIGSDLIGFKTIVFKICKTIDEWFLVERASLANRESSRQTINVTKWVG